MRLFLNWVMTAFLVFYSAVSFATNTVAEVVWVDSSNDQNHIYYSAFDGEEWVKQSEPIYSSDNPLTTPALGTSANGRKLLIWSERKRLKTVLMVIRSSVSNEQVWSEPEVFSDYGQENLSPSILFDFNNTAWVFWSASSNEPSDVYVVKSMGIGWSEPQRVNQKNKVPDSHPLAQINKQGDIEVEWSSYNLDLNGYQLESKLFLLEASSQLNEQYESLLDKDSSLDDIVMPGFIPSNKRILLHFPNNKVKQNTALP